MTLPTYSKVALLLARISTRDSRLYGATQSLPPEGAQDGLICGPICTGGLSL